MQIEASIMYVTNFAMLLRTLLTTTHEPPSQLLFFQPDITEPFFSATAARWLPGFRVQRSLG